MPVGGFKRHLPNALTVARLLLSLVFFAMLAFAPRLGGADDESRRSTLYLNIATLIYVIAAATDFLDGYLARKWNVVTAFGRVVDPFVDKILVLGAFIYFAGPAFIGGTPPVSLSGVSPTIVVILLGREFLVTTLRSVAEGAGTSFAAAWTGKLKMVLQCITIFVVLMYVNYRPMLLRIDGELWGRWLRDGCVWITVLVTVFSAWTYVQRSIAVSRGKI
jgi:CDP-diacylglycerol--glycerol-3-phosphate 3-phosphatidyltransferase